MDTALTDLLACVAAFARSLHEAFDPARFLAEFSERAQRLVPHDRMLIAYLEGDGRTSTLFAEYAAHGSAVHACGSYTIAFDPGGRVACNALALESVFAGHWEVAGDLPSDPRFADAASRRKLLEAHVRARIAVPLYAGGRVIGAFVVASATPDTYDAAHVEACRQIADLIGPFIETVVLLHRERRRRQRLEAVTALGPILGSSLQVGDVLERLGEAVKPMLDFDVMGLGLLKASGDELERVGVLDVDSDRRHPQTTPIADYSVLERTGRGEVVLIQDAERELDARRIGDRRIVEGGIKSGLMVPLLFGDRVGGTLFFAKRRPHWYDDADVEVAKAIAAALVVAVQHQRLADEQQRLGAAEAKARQLEQRVASLRGALEERFGFGAVIGRAPAFLQAMEQARRVAATETTVLLTGESGTGKEVVARAIHHASPRADAPFVAINCAALPETLIESELFGHERGAFTGADKLKRGRFELAQGGTLFLDEIGELTPAVQAKLLRVLQERQYERVGGTVMLHADVRLLAATNRDLERAVADGRFREDLYYRLAVFRIYLPALRERGDDVLLLADHFVREFGARMGKGGVGLSRQARDVLLSHRWPGNIRELQNAVERALILADDGLISGAQLGIVTPVVRVIPDGTSAVVTLPVRPPAVTQPLAELEKQSITDALRRANGNKSHAAAALGLSRSQLHRRLRRFGLTA